MVCYIELDGVLVDTSLLGQTITVKHPPWAYRIDLPTEPVSFTFSRMTLGGPKDERDYEATQCFVGEPERGFVEIRIIRVAVNGTFDSPGRDSPEYEAWAHERFHDLRETALAAARDLSSSLRLRGQPGIEPSGRFPRVLNMMQMAELDGKEIRPFNWALGSASGVIHIVDDDGILDAARLDAVRDDLEQERSAWVGETLVSEALYLADSQQVSAPAQATLIAAMGVEVQTKAVLRHLVADDDREPLLDLLLENPRDWSASALSMFAKALPTLVGRELGEAHKGLKPRVQKLFEARNRVAHRGSSLSQDEAKVHVATARDVMYYLRTLL